MIIFYSMLLLLQDPAAGTGRDPLAYPWVQSLSATCDSHVVELKGYGASNGPDSVAHLFFDSKSVVGEYVENLTRDLSHRGAVYRFRIYCYEQGTISIHIDRGEHLTNKIVYGRGEAVFRSGQLISYTGLQESDEEVFWF